MFDEEQLRTLGDAERLRLIRALVAMESPEPATGWAAWRRKQVLIICLAVLATLLCCDAWFDVVLDARTAGFELSLLSALIIELPLAALAAWGARRLLLMSVAVVRRYEGEQGPPPSMRQAPLIGGSLAPHLTEPPPGSTEVPVTNVSAEQSDTSLPFGGTAGSYDRLRFFPSAEAISWLLRAGTSGAFLTSRPGLAR